MAAQRHDPAARAPHVAEQQLQDRAGADVLHADAVLGPADAVDERRGAVAAGVLGQGPATSRNASVETPQVRETSLGGVAGEVPLEDLVDAARVLERLVALAGRSLDLDAVGLVLQRARRLALHRRGLLVDVVLALLARRTASCSGS